MTLQEDGPAQRAPYWTMPRVAGMTVAIVAIVAVALLMVKLAAFLMMVFSAVVLAVIFDTLARLLCRMPGVGRGAGLALAVVGLILLFAAVFALFGTQIAGEVDTIKTSIPPAIDRMKMFLESVGLGDQVAGLLDQSNADIRKYLGQASGIAMATGSIIANAVIVVAGAIFFAADPGLYRRGLLLLVPKAAEPVATEALDDVGRGLHGWMVGQAMSSAVVAMLTWAGLAILGVPASAGLGLVAGLLDVIPMVGPIIAGVPAVLLAFTVSPQTALWTVLLFLLVQQLQGNFLQPMIQKHAVNVPPAILLFAVVGIGALFGFIGVLLAAPFTILCFVLVQRIYVKAILKRDIEPAQAD